MEIMTGTKREITIALWQEQIEKHVKRANDSMECFRRHHEADDLKMLIEDCQAIIKNAQSAAEAIEYMDLNNIK